jgi:hypothetical protein
MLQGVQGWYYGARSLMHAHKCGHWASCSLERGCGIGTLCWEHCGHAACHRAISSVSPSHARPLPGRMSCTRHAGPRRGPDAKAKGCVSAVRVHAWLVLLKKGMNVWHLPRWSQALLLRLAGPAHTQTCKRRDLKKNADSGCDTAGQRLAKAQAKLLRRGSSVLATTWPRVAVGECGTRHTDAPVGNPRVAARSWRAR